MKTKNMITQSIRNSICRSPLPRRSFNEGGSLITYYYLATPKPSEGRSLLTILHPRRGFLLIPLVLAWFALSPTPNAFGVLPAPDGGYPSNNTAEGDDALFSNITGSNNTANGYQALYSNITGSNNTANGHQALYSNITASNNTAIGALALNSNTTGNNNTANGVNALYSNTTGINNTANGDNALSSNTTGYNNTANGINALS